VEVGNLGRLDSRQDGKARGNLGRQCREGGKPGGWAGMEGIWGGRQKGRELIVEYGNDCLYRADRSEKRI
jgi:hypothetical protein